MKLLKLRASIAAIGTAAALGGTGALLLPASASTHTVTHTLRFTAVQQATAHFSRTSSGTQEKDVNHSGKVIGYDLLYFKVNPKTGQASARVALDTKGGFLYGVLHLTNNPVLHGRVTGGTGAFRGASGTITARTLNRAATRTAVTIRYHT